MIALTETTIAMTVAVLGVFGTLVWYGIRTLKEMRDAVSDGSPNNE